MDRGRNGAGFHAAERIVRLLTLRRCCRPLSRQWRPEVHFRIWPIGPATGEMSSAQLMPSERFADFSFVFN
jgi:hypothetical protein